MTLGANKAAIMGVAGVSTGDVVLLSTQTADGDASITFSSDITSTYGEYIFKWYNFNPGTDNSHFTFQANAVDASGYNETITSTWFQAVHDEANTHTSLSYTAASDQAQGTAYQKLLHGTGNGADESSAGELHLFNPSSTTYVKHFIARCQNLDGNNNCVDHFLAGYFNITEAIDDIQFKVSTGVFDGKIKMWGVK